MNCVVVSKWSNGFAVAAIVGVDGHVERDELESLATRQLELLGEDPARDGLLRTPHHVAGSMTWLTRGHGLDVADVVNGALFDEPHANMVLVRPLVSVLSSNQFTCA